MLILNDAQMMQILTPEEVMDKVKEAFALYEQKNFFMPHRIHKDFNNKTLLYMPSASGKCLGTKYLTLMPENIAKGLPTIYGLMILNDYDTGRPLCILDGKTLTAVRTGGVGGLGIKYTTPNNVSSIGLVGTGVQGYYQLMYASRVRNFSKICLFDTKMENILSFKARVSGFFPDETNFVLCTSTEQLLEESEVIITTTTASTPVLPSKSSAFKGKHFIGVGSYKPTMREFPDELFEVVDNIFTDVDLAKEESGDLADPIKNGILNPQQIYSFGQHILDQKDIEKVKKSTTFFKTVGMALFDVTVGDAMYQKALKENIGVKVDI